VDLAAIKTAMTLFNPLTGAPSDIPRLHASLPVAFAFRSN